MQKETDGRKSRRRTSTAAFGGDEHASVGTAAGLHERRGSNPGAASFIEFSSIEGGSGANGVEGGDVGESVGGSEGGSAVVGVLGGGGIEGGVGGASAGGGGGKGGCKGVAARAAVPQKDSRWVLAALAWAALARARWAGRQQQQCKKTDNRVLCRIRIHVRIPFTEQPEPEKTFADHAEVAII